MTPQYKNISAKLLCTFLEYEDMTEVVDLIRKTYDILYDKIFVFRILEISKVVLTYNIDAVNVSDFALIPNTIVVNRNKTTNTLYTVNAFKSLAGDKPTLNWFAYKNKLLVTEDNKVCIYSTHILNIIHL